MMGEISLLQSRSIYQPRHKSCNANMCYVVDIISCREGNLAKWLSREGGQPMKKVKIVSFTRVAWLVTCHVLLAGSSHPGRIKYLFCICMYVIL